MWIFITTVLIVTGGLTILDAPARARRHAAERALVLRALARSGSYGTEAGVARAFAHDATPRGSLRIACGQLTSLEEDGMISAFWSGTGANRSRRYRLLVDLPSDAASDDAQDTRS